MIFDRFIRWVFSITGHCSFINHHFRMKRWCPFCHMFVMDLNHVSKVVAMKFPNCKEII